MTKKSDNYLLDTAGDSETVAKMKRVNELVKSKVIARIIENSRLGPVGVTGNVGIGGAAGVNYPVIKSKFSFITEDE